MPIEFTWLLPDHILLSRWTGIVTPADMRILTDELQVVFEHAIQPVHTVIDLHEISGVEGDIMAVYFTSPASTSLRRGQIVVINLPESLTHLVTHANTIAGRNLIHVFEDRVSAQNYLLGLDSTDHGPPAER